MKNSRITKSYRAFKRMPINKTPLFVLFFILFKVGTGQDPLSSFGVHSLDMTQSNPYLNPTPLPSPGNDEEVHYNSQKPYIHQNAQYCAHGDLMFFINDGFIYNKDGYLIADAQIRYLNGIPEDAGYENNIYEDHFFNQPDVIISPVPGSCNLFYVIFGLTDSEQYFYNAGEEGIKIRYCIVDILRDNPNFSDPEIMGGLVTADNISEYPSLDPNQMNTWAEGSYSELIVIPKALNKPYAFMELLDFSGNTTKKLYISYASKLRVFNVGADKITISQTIDLVNCSGGVTSSIGLLPPPGQNNNQSPSKLIAGDMVMTYNAQQDKYYLAFNDQSGIPFNLQTDHVVHVVRLNNMGQYESELTCINANGVSLYGFNFSPNGRYLYLVPFSSSADIGCYDVDAQSLIDAPLLTSSFSGYTYRKSRLSLGLRNITEKGLYVAGPNNQVRFIANADIPGAAVLESISLSPQVQNGYYDMWRFFLDYEENINTGLDFGFYFFSEQNYRGTQIQDFLDTEQCCLLMSPMCNEPDTYFDGSGNWTPTDNLFGDDQTVRFDGVLTFGPNTNLEIDDMRFEFAPSARIILEPGAYVRMSNCTLTSLHCDQKMWPGVVIKGTANAEQTYSGGETQGKLVLRAGSLVENALVGVEVKGGGILLSLNSTYRNNQIGVFMREHSYQTQNNRTYLLNSEFITDSPLNNPALPLSTHLRLWKVQGVRVEDCSFLNTAAFSTYSINKRGTGISSYDSSFKLYGENLPYDGGPEHDAFYRLTYGVMAVAYGERTFSCENMEFQGCRTGIRVGGVKNELITYNNFSIPGYNSVPGENNRGPEGMYILGSRGYTIEENMLEGEFRERNTGIIIDNSGRGNNEIFRNHYSHLNTGFYNRQINGGAIDDGGLEVRCEWFEENGRDMYLSPNSIWRYFQGQQNGLPARQTNNKFSDNGCPTIGKDISISQGYGVAPDFDFLYYHLAGDETIPDCESPHMDPDVPQGLENEDFDYGVHCPSNFGPTDNGGWHIAYEPDDSRDRSQLENDQAQELVYLEDAQELYHLTVDNGEKLDLLEAIQSTLTVNSAELKNLLYAKSPLSEEVLKSSITRSTPMDPWHLTQVLLANTPLRRDVLYLLEEQAVLSDFFMTFLYNAQNNAGNGIKQLLEFEMSHRSQVIAHLEKKILFKLIHEGRADTEAELGPDPVEYFARLEGRSDENSIEELVVHAWEHGLSNEALAYLALLPETSSRRAWLETLITLDPELRLQEAGIEDELWSIYHSEGSEYDRALVLLHLADPELEEWPIIAEPEDRIAIWGDNLSFLESREGLSLLTASPNPAHDQLFIGYPAEADGLAELKLHDMLGRQVYSVSLKDKGLIELDIRTWEKGIYLASLWSNGIQMDALKFSVE